MVLHVAAWLALAAISSADIINKNFAEWSSRGSDDDLFRFVTRPDLTPPRFNIPINKKGKTAPGYIFVAPYDCLECSKVATTSYVTQQIGPHIYTQEGELVWSGNELFPDKKVFDFKPVMINGENHLALISPEDAEWRPYPDGIAMILDASYQPVWRIGSEELGHRIDMHEFNILDGGKTALIGMKNFRLPAESDHVKFQGKMMDCLFTELDLQTMQPSFDWKASDHVDIEVETSNPPPKNGEQPPFWDWFHLNSMDKDKFGNYLISARATNTIYYISSTGRILWRLGGPKSDFQQDFNFSRQHHARVQRQSKANMVISFFDNAADDSGKWTPTANSSGLNIVGLEFDKMTARLYHRMDRPDGGLSEAKGNVQFLPGGGVFGGWGENALMTEYTSPGGETVYEASFATTRFANYRAYKAPFVAQPKTRPVTKAFVSTTSRAQFITSIYVSWNGATEVAKWRFYARAARSGVQTIVHIGDAVKTGFETNFIASGYHPIIFAEAVDVHGTSLANSTLEVTEIPKGFHRADDPMKAPSQHGGDLQFRLVVAFMAGIAVTIVWQRSLSGRQSFTSHRPRFSRWEPKRS